MWRIITERVDRHGSEDYPGAERDWAEMRAVHHREVADDLVEIADTTGMPDGVAVIMAAGDWSVPMLAELYDADIVTVRGWVAAVQARGYRALAEHWTAKAASLPAYPGTEDDDDATG